VELHATLGRKLSDEFQDGRSYRYGIVNLGGRDRTHVLEQFEACRNSLGIVLLPVGPAHAEAIAEVAEGERKDAVIDEGLQILAGLDADGKLNDDQKGWSESFLMLRNGSQ
jgi:hypothetical protein